MSRTYRIWIKAEPAAIWNGITDPATLATYGYGGVYELDPTVGATHRVLATDEMKAFGAPEVMLDGEILAAEPERLLSMTWRAYFSEEMAAEPATTVTYEIEPLRHGVSKVTLTHAADGAPLTAAITSGDVAEAGGGFAFVLSDLKTLLETGSPLPPQMG